MKREWENPQIQSQGREVPRATLFPYPTEALALSGERDDCPSFKLLNGTWDFVYSETGRGLEGFEREDFELFEDADALPVPLIVSIKFRGDVAAVEAAVEAGAAAAERVSGVVSRHIIPNPEGDTEKMLKINALDKN